MPRHWESVTRIGDGRTFKITACLVPSDEEGLLYAQEAWPHVMVSVNHQDYPLPVRVARKMAQRMLDLATEAERLNELRGHAAERRNEV